MRRVRFVVLSVVSGMLVVVLSACSQTTAPYYKVAVSPSKASAGLADSVAPTVSLRSENGFAGTLRLSLLDASGHPAPGFTLRPSTLTLAAGQSLSRKVTVTPGASVPAGPYDLRVSTSGGGVPRSAALTMTLASNATGTFQSPKSYPVGSYPIAVATGDFNGDGTPDLAVANSSDNNVSVLLGNGNGTFQKAVSYPAGTSPRSLAVGDFNGDGTPDLAVANGGNLGLAGVVSVLLGNGDGTFRKAVRYSAGNAPISLAVGDFNGDGKLDLAVGNPGGAGAVSVLLGNGDGTFQGAVSYPLSGTPYSLAVGDFNGDGNLDLVAAAAGSSGVSVLLGNGDGTFQGPVDYTAGTYPTSVAVGDFNGDGKPDLVTAGVGGSGTVSVLLGNGDGSFQRALSYPAGTTQYSIAVGDFNGDGKLDIAVPNHTSTGSVSVLLGQ